MFELPNKVRLIGVAALKCNIGPAQELIVLHLHKYVVETLNSLKVLRRKADKLLELRNQMFLCACVTANDLIEF